MRNRTLGALWLCLGAVLMMGTGANAQSWAQDYSLTASAQSTTSVGAAGTSTGVPGFTDETGLIYYITGKAVLSVPVTSGGSGYTASASLPLTFTGGTPQFAATGNAITNSSGVITSVTLTYTGQGYASAPTVTVTTPGSGSGVVFGAVALSGNLVASASSPNSGTHYLGNLDRPASGNTLSQRAVNTFLYTGQDHGVARVRINNAAGQWYEVDCFSGSQILYYINAGTGTNLSSASAALTVGHYYSVDLSAVSPVSTTNLSCPITDLGTDLSAPTSTVVATLSKTADASAGVQTAGQAGFGTSGRLMASAVLTTYVQSGLVVSPSSSNLGTTTAFTVSRAGGAAWTPGTPGSPIFTASGGGAVITSQTVTGGSTATVSVSTGGVGATLTLTDPLNSLTGTASLVAMTAPAPAFSGLSPTGVTLTPGTDLNANGAVTHQVYRSTQSFTPPGAGTLVGSGTVTDSGLLPNTAYWYKTLSTDSGSPAQTVASAATVLNTPAVTPYSYLAIAGDSTDAGSSGAASLLNWLGSPLPVSGGSGYTSSFAFTYPAPTGTGTPRATATGYAYVSGGQVQALGMTSHGYGYNAAVAGNGSANPIVFSVPGGSGGGAQFNLYNCGGWALAMERLLSNTNPARQITVYDEAHGGANSQAWAVTGGVPSAYIMAMEGSLPPPSSCPVIVFSSGPNDLGAGITPADYYTYVKSFCDRETGRGYTVDLFPPTFYQGATEAQEETLRQYGVQCAAIAAANPNVVLCGQTLFGFFAMNQTLIVGPHPNDEGYQDEANQLFPTIAAQYGLTPAPKVFQPRRGR